MAVSVDPNQRYKTRASFIKDTQKMWEKRFKDKEDNEHAATVERRVNSLLDQGWSFEDISKDTGLGTSSIQEFVDITRPGYGVKEPGPGVVEGVTGAVSRGATSVLAGVGRFGGAGTAQLLGGAADLLTPGEGTNRLSDWGSQKARELDVIARDHGNQPIYTGTQIAGELVAGAATGGALTAATKGARGSAALAKYGNKLDDVAKGAETLLAKGKMPTFSKLANTGIKGGFTPTNIAQDAYFTSKQVAEDAANNERITPGRVAAEAGLFVGGNMVGTVLGDKLLDASKPAFRWASNKLGGGPQAITDEARLLPEFATITDETRMIGTGADRIQREIDELDSVLVPAQSGEVPISSNKGPNYSSPRTTVGQTAEVKQQYNSLKDQLKTAKQNLDNLPTEKDFAKREKEMYAKHTRAIKAVNERAGNEELKSKWVQQINDNFDAEYQQLVDDYQKLLADKAQAKGIVEDTQRRIQNLDQARLNQGGYMPTKGTDGSYSVEDIKKAAQRKAELEGKLAEINQPHPEIQKIDKRIQEIDDTIAEVQQGNKQMDVTDARKLMRERQALMDKKTVPRYEATKKAGKQFKNTEIPKEAGRVKRAVITVKGQLSGMGKAGKELSSRLDEAEAISEISQGKWSQAIPTVFKLKGKNFTAFVDGLETLSKGGELPSNTSPKIRQAIAEWSDLAPKIRQEALDAGLDVGDLGPYYFPKTYPQLSTKKGLAKAAKHLVDTGQAENLGEARKILDGMNKTLRAKPFGHLEMSRVVDLPDFDKSRGALAQYLGFSGDRIGNAKMFGADNSVANQLIDELENAGHSGDRANELMKIALGDKEYSPTRAKVSSGIRKFNTFRLLRKAAISNAAQPTNTATVSGLYNTLEGAFKLLSPKQRRFIQETGVTADAVLQNLAQEYGISSTRGVSGLAGKIATPFFGTIEKFNRSLTASAGEVWAQKLAAKGTTKATKQLRRLGVKGEIGARLTPEQATQAARGLVERTQFKVGAKDLPAWTNSPEGKMVAQFRSFTYKQTGFMYNEVIKPMGELNFAPLARFAAIALPVGLAVNEGKNFASSKIEGGKDYGEGNSIGEDIISAYEALGSFGFAGDIKFAAEQYNKPGSGFEEAIAGLVGGPTAGYAVGTLSDIGRARAGDSTGLKRRGIEAATGPFGKSISNRVAPYENNDLTANFGDSSEEVTKVTEEIGYKPKNPSREQRGRELSDEEYDRYLNEYSAIWLNKYRMLSSVEGFAQAPASTKKRLLQVVTRQSGEEARNRVLGEEETNKAKLPTNDNALLESAGLR